MQVSRVPRASLALLEPLASLAPPASQETLVMPLLLMLPFSRAQECESNLQIDDLCDVLTSLH